MNRAAYSASLLLALGGLVPAFGFQDASAPQSQPPASASTPNSSAPQNSTNEQQSQAASQASESKNAAGPSKRKRGARHKKPSQPPSEKVVVRNGGARENSPQLTLGMSKEQELHDRESTSQLLTTTESNLRSAEGRQLTPSQQGMIDQIRHYLAQSRAATDSGDLARAHTLAYKAHLLSDELVKK